MYGYKLAGSVAVKGSITRLVKQVQEVGNRIFVANPNSNTVSVINGDTNTVIATVPVGLGSAVVGVNPSTDRIYVANSNPNSNTV